MDSTRHNAESEYKYKLYFNLLPQKIAAYNVEPEHIYNMDEKGFAIEVLGRTKRIFSRRPWEKKEVRQARQDGSREWVSVLAAIYADGTALSLRCHLCVQKLHHPEPLGGGYQDRKTH